MPARLRPARRTRSAMRHPIALPVPLGALPTPALLVDRDRLAANISAMALAARQAGVGLRPHFKTSKCLAIAQAQTAAGALGFTAATAAEVAALRDAGVSDVLWAHQPVGPAKVAFAVSIATRGGVTFALDSVEVARPLSAAAADAGVRVPYLIEVDSGLGRSGVAPQHVPALAGELAALPNLLLRGVFTHEGHLSRHIGDRSGLEKAGRGVGEAMTSVAEALHAAGFPCDVVSVGSTPGATSVPYVPGVTEARPGTYVFFDANQVALRSATLEQCALNVLARVITVRADGTAIIDAGTKALSSDPSMAGNGFGLAGDGLTVAAANEEHGFVSGPGTAGLRVGDLLRVVPNHACGTVNMWSGMYVVDGENAVEYWETVARH
ncbi:alanine racemase [Micromonospora sp. DR5-3]|uniref:alanine racemase n=1 Tax=unclassified Micromonospora TaxID=2617518 RepID=UPI0011D7640F|nr:MULTISPECIES: alanine racemase [unclassified Micromonospora]MCW3818916.1 alanine racemase [Micromonospora sp. DR5-3]TYC20940.1 alanine racemase [Micromonospora sp. MP36]